MHAIGRRLGVQAMSLYRHVEDKADLLDGLVELVVSEIEVPTSSADWKAAMRQRATWLRTGDRREIAQGIIRDGTARAD